MESNRIVYTKFTKFVISLINNQLNDLQKTQEIIKNCFQQHPFYTVVEKNLSKKNPPKNSTDFLFEKTISICEDFGPDRDYITLIFVLEELKQKTKIDAFSNYISSFKTHIETINASIPPPPLYNVLLETRSVIEWSSMFWLYNFIPKHKTKHNTPVLFMPPYLGNDITTKFVRKYLQSLGYKTYKWELGVNMINSKYLPKLTEKLDEIYKKHNQKVALVGWSGGGIFAKIIANRHPDKVAQLITIGSPVWGIKSMKTPVIRTLEFLRGTKLKERNEKFIKELEKIPKVPITCIYTKTDGLVPWKHCLEAETYRANIKNVEVFGSHCGMGANATVLLTVANALNLDAVISEKKSIIEKVESVFFPEFWETKGLAKFTNLLQ